MTTALLLACLSLAQAQDVPADPPPATDAPAAPADEGPDPADAPPIAPRPGSNAVAVVIGLSSYANLPPAVELDFARSDAALVEKALRERAKFTHTFLLTDAKATREGVRELLRTEVAQLVGPDDLFLLYFVGHGIGADLDEPALLTFDSTVEAVHEDGLELGAFAQDLATFTQAGRSMVVTDAIHSNQLDGVYFFGPAANQWPAMRPNTLLLSSSQADSPARDGAFGTVFADGIAGAADRNRDRSVTAGELYAYLTERIGPIGQLPVSAGDYAPGMVLATGVDPTAATDPSATSAPIPDAQAQFPDTQVWSAKFVFREGASQTVRCRETATRACAPSCYMREFKAGICELGAVVDGAQVKGQVAVVYPGKYDCGMRAGMLTCKPPLPGAADREADE